MNLKKELLAYLISGGITTGVNYFLYAALLFLHLPWLSIDLLGIAAVPAKLLVSIVTVAGNYILCKYGIFKKEVSCHE